MIILITAGVLCGVATAVLGLIMHIAINSKLPEDQRLSWRSRWGPSVSTLCSMYDQLYPDNYLSPLLRVAYIGSFVIGASLLAVLFMRGK